MAKTTNNKSSAEFKVGKHTIGRLDPYFTKHFGSLSFESTTLGTFQTLPRSMNDSEIESELKPGLCELGDVLAFLDNAPEECKDGYANIFYIKDSPFVVGVYRRAFFGGWVVNAWDRGDDRWDSGSRVFSPATGTSNLDTQHLGALTLGPSAQKPPQYISCKRCGDEVPVPKGTVLCYECKEESNPKRQNT